MKNILNKEVAIGEGEIIVTEQVETKYNRQLVEERLSNIRRNKQRLIQENLYIIDEYNKLLEEESEFNGYLESLTLEVDEPKIIV